MINEKPTIYASEVKLMAAPVMPVGEERTNCNMHNYRVQWQQMACDTAILLDNLSNRLTDGETRVAIPQECLTLLQGGVNYCAAD